MVAADILDVSGQNVQKTASLRQRKRFHGAL
jgi:hypothetical protein